MLLLYLDETIDDWWVLLLLPSSSVVRLTQVGFLRLTVDRCHSHRFPRPQAAPQHDGNSHQRADDHERVSNRTGEDIAENRTIADVVYSRLHDSCANGRWIIREITSQFKYFLTKIQNFSFQCPCSSSFILPLNEVFIVPL